MGSLQRQVESFATMHNATETRKLNLVFFRDAMKHLCRISRCLSQPRGHSLLIGVGGSGRQSLTRMAKTVNSYEFFMIKISKNYKEPKWREDLNYLLKTAGKDNKKFIFLLSDTQIIYESFLEDINNILNTGEVPNLLKEEDNNEICEAIKPYAKQFQTEDTKDALMELFTYLVRENLHIALSFSPVGEKLRERCRQFPSIIDCCTIDWFDKWPDEALYSVAVNQIKDKENEVLSKHTETLAKI